MKYLIIIALALLITTIPQGSSCADFYLGFSLVIPTRTWLTLGLDLTDDMAVELQVGGFPWIVTTASANIKYKPFDDRAYVLLGIARVESVMMWSPSRRNTIGIHGVVGSEIAYQGSDARTTIEAGLFFGKQTFTKRRWFDQDQVRGNIHTDAEIVEVEKKRIVWPVIGIGHYGYPKN